MSLEAPHPPPRLPALKAVRLGLHTQHEAIALIRADSPVCKSEGLAPRAQVLLSAGGCESLVTLYQVEDHLVGDGEIGLSEAAWRRLGAEPDDLVTVRHPPPLDSLSHVRQRIYGNRLSPDALKAIITDVVAGRYADVHLAAFITACSALPLDHDEIVALTRAMVDVGERMSWGDGPIVDKHCVGGLPGNRTTPIIVSIVASHGLKMPKTSSRAITSPSGTADTMETMAPVALDLHLLRKVVESEGGCIAWGGAMRLSPADDILIRVERVLDIDSEGQLIASVLSKKIAAGSGYVVLDIPVGPTAKVRSQEAADHVAAGLESVAAAFGLKTLCLQTDGQQPVGRGIGPALEAHDVLAVLRNRPEAPADLADRACVLAGAALELGGAARPGAGEALARQTLADGRAWTKFQAICEAQGGMRTPPVADLRQAVTASRSGRLVFVNNRKISKVAKLAGAPGDKAAGVEMHVRLGDEIQAGQPLMSIHAESPGELDYALDYAITNTDMFDVEP